MKYGLIFSFLAICFAGYGQIINFPDANFKNALVNTKCVDNDDNNGPDSDADLNNDGEIDVNEASAVKQLYVSHKGIQSLVGIEKFNNLTLLNCSSNQLTVLNVHGLIKLETLTCNSNKLTSLSLQGLMNLKEVICNYNQLTSLDVNGLINLETLNCYSNKLTSLEVQGLLNLKVLDCGSNLLTTLVLQGLIHLEELTCYYNQLTSLDVKGLINLKELNCINNQLILLDVHGLIKLETLTCNSNKLTSLSLQGLINLKYLTCYSNQLTTVDVQGLINLETLTCYSNKLTSLNVNDLVNLKELSCFFNQLTSLDVNGLINLETLTCYSNKITSFSLQGLINLENLACYSNKLTTLDVQGLINLKTLTCYLNNLTTLDVQGLINLETLTCYSNNLTSLSLQGLINLKYLTCSSNQLTLLHVQGLINLNYLSCRSNQLTSVNIQDMTKLKILNCQNNQLKTLDVQGLIALEDLECQDNQLTSLNVQGLTKLKELVCSSNQLTSLYLKNTKISNGVEFLHNPNLKYICCDEEKITQIKNQSKSYGQNCEVNSYCTFTPGGKFYVLNGENRYDVDINGCDEQDVLFPYLKYHISNGNTESTLISSFTGSYSIPIQAGKHTITPIIEYPNHFESIPSSYTVTFPSTSDTITQNFCITPKSTIFRQTNITILPLTPPARPGFDASYKIVWENVGNQIESGTLNFTYDESLLDYISAIQMADQVADGIVKWSFTNLLPFEKREITVTLKVNRPTDTPAVNAGEKLYLTASILDNIFTLENTVVGSYDPNDKTCLQGDRIKPDMIGKYVDYLIRFENTGNYAAENVIVKDIIDTKRFDVSTLQITDASHEVYTRIEGNKVEFIFEKIQLPFDDANNYGYIAFKIKTLPTLILGDSLKNKADIYFDYNFPIRTNEAKTTIALSVSSADITTDISIYPNPVRDILYLQTDEIWTKAEIYDISGRIMRSISLKGNSIDLSGLESGTYIVRLNNGEKEGRVKFVKM